MQYKIENYLMDQTIFKEGDVANHAYLIKRGSVRIFKHINDVHVHLTDLLGGDVFGELSVLRKETRTASAMAIEYTELVVINQSTLLTHIKKSSPVIRSIFRKLMSRVVDLTGRLSETQTQTNDQSTFMAICNILEMMHTIHLHAPVSDRSSDHDLGINYLNLSKKIRDIMPISQYDIGETIKKLHEIEIIEVQYKKSASTDKSSEPVKGNTREHKNDSAEKFIKILYPDNFLHFTKKFYSELQEFQPDPVADEIDFIDIDDFASIVKTSSKIIYKKICAGEIPESIFCINRPEAVEWASEMGEDYFKKAGKPQVELEDIECIDDIVYVKDVILQEALSRVGHNKLCTLTLMADENARSIIFRNISSKLATIIKEEMETKVIIDKVEAYDIEEEFIEKIKELVNESCE